MVHRMMAGKSNDYLYVTTSPITVIFSTWLFKDQGKCHGFETVASIGFVCRRSMCGSSVDWTLKNAGDTIDLSWFGLLGPTSSSVVFFVLGIPNRGITTVKSRESLVGDCVVLS
jgi:hypothetical protein